ncbi:MAG: peptidylprolyl isomerase [Tannerellaceae bacterium]|nr:peptidylprolyl isomerase [Tannerellaceae bacterium]
MRKILIGLLVLTSIGSKAQKSADTVVMVVGDRKIYLDEFTYIAQKNNEVDFSDSESLTKYVELFKNFKLKVVEAEHLGFDKSESFEKEWGEYKNQLEAAYLSDKKGEEAYARALYEKANTYLDIKHILIPFSSRQCLSKDTVAPYLKAMEIYGKITGSLNFDTVGVQYSAAPVDGTLGNTAVIKYERLPYFLPLQKDVAFENMAYATPAGGITKPFRSAEGYHIIKVESRWPYFGGIHVAYINIPYEQDSLKRTKEEVNALINEIYSNAVAGEDFTSLVYKYSADTLDAGVLSWFGPGEMVKSVEVATYALTNPGDISQPVITEIGAYIFKLLEKRPTTPFEDVSSRLITEMGRKDKERNFELFKTYDEYLKKEYKYTLYPKAYAEIEKLAEDFFPTSERFNEKISDMSVPLFRLGSNEFTQKDFGKYILEYPYSSKTYSKEFLAEELLLFVREKGIALETQNLGKKYPEITYLLKEYHDGILLFNISNEKIWSQPLNEQDSLEVTWLKELGEKYPVTVNQNVLKQLSGKKR